MRICVIVEGCYPYVVGGVSSWVHNLIRSFPKQEFVILSIVVDRSWRGKFVYDLPDNVTEVHELYLEDSDWGKKKKRHKKRMDKKEYHALRSLLLNQQVEWETLFDLFQYENFSISDPVSYTHLTLPTTIGV
jgi:glycosyltransferase involved in cell wall biosynthesis